MITLLPTFCWYVKANEATYSIIIYILILHTHTHTHTHTPHPILYTHDE